MEQVELKNTDIFKDEKDPIDVVEHHLEHVTSVMNSYADVRGLLWKYEELFNSVCKETWNMSAYAGAGHGMIYLHRLKRKDAIKIMSTVGGKWDKTTFDGTQGGAALIAYGQKMGVIKVLLLTDELPPGCHIETKQVVVPTHTVNEHTETITKVVCTNGSEVDNEKL